MQKIVWIWNVFEEQCVVFSVVAIGKKCDSDLAEVKLLLLSRLSIGNVLVSFAKFDATH